MVLRKAKEAKTPNKKPVKEMSRGERVIAFIESHCHVPEGKWVGRLMVLDPFQKNWILDTYDNPHVTTRSILSIARKNGKTALIAALVLVHLVGPEAQLNSSVVSGASSKEQASLVFKAARKMVELSSELSSRVKVLGSTKSLIGLKKNVEYKALSADKDTNHGLSPILVILDETGRVRGAQDDFIDSLVTAQGAYEDPLQIVISTQAKTDADLFSIWIDDALSGEDPTLVCHLYAATEDCNVADTKEWAKANPAIETFGNFNYIKKMSEQASRMPSFENSFRNLILNQRVEIFDPFMTPAIWAKNSEEMRPIEGRRVYAGLDLSRVTDLTSMVVVSEDEDGFIDVWPFFWTPKEGLKAREERDRTPYTLWAKRGLLKATPGNTVDYNLVILQMETFFQENDLEVIKINFDRWNINAFKRELEREELDWPMEPFGQGYQSMSPAIDAVERFFMDGLVRHGDNPVLKRCISNSVVERDAAENRKLNKAKSTGRIDGAVAMVMAFAAMAGDADEEEPIDRFLQDRLII
jgi:phage terminase large subunit-like protein